MVRSMIVGARKMVALLLCAALVAGAVPREAAAFVRASPVAARASSPVDGASAMKVMRRFGVTKGPGDVLETYLVSGGRLTDLGRAVYLSLVKAHDPALEPRALAEEAQSMQTALNRLRENGPYNHFRARKVDGMLKQFQKSFGKAALKADDTVEGQFWLGALREALMTGAAVPDPPKAEDRVQVKTKDGYEFWDKKGLAYRINKHNATLYNRELQKMQRLMNQSRPPEVAFVPETGRYNPEMFDYSYFSLKNQYDALAQAWHRDRVMALAELLGEVQQYRDDQWDDPSLEKNLEAKARKKTIVYNNADYNVLRLVDEKFVQRRAYLDAALGGVNNFKSDVDDLKGDMKKNPIVTDARVQSLMLDEQYARRLLTLGALETQLYSVKNLMERVDPSAPDSEQLMKAIDRSGMEPDLKAAYKSRAGGISRRLVGLRNVLEKARLMLSGADYAGSLEMANAALTSCQRALGMVSNDYTMYLEIPTLMFLGTTQKDPSWWHPGTKLSRGVLRWWSPRNRNTMAKIAADQPQYERIAQLIAAGKMAQARQAAIALHPGALKTHFDAALSGDGSSANDAARLLASLKVGHERIASVFEANQWADAFGSWIDFSLQVALSAPFVRVGCNGVANWLTKFTKLTNAGKAEYVLLRRPAIILEETLRHTEARLGELEPDPIKIDALSKSNLVRFLAPSGTRFATVFMRQGAFTATAAGIQGAFAVGQHNWKNYWEKDSSPFDSWTEALKEGAKGGFFWSNKDLEAAPNEPIELFGFLRIHPGLLNYVGLPASVFKDTKYMPYAEMIGSRGVVDAGANSWRMFWGGEAAKLAMEKEAGHGFLETLGEAGPLGQAVAFPLSMADNVAKFFLLDQAMGTMAKTDFWGRTRLFNEYAPDDGPERSLKRRNLRAERWQESPLWMLIPQYAAHTIRDAQAAMLAHEGFRQARTLAVERGDYSHVMGIANAMDSEALLRMPNAAETPMSQKIYEVKFLAADREQKFSVPLEVRREAIEFVLPDVLGGKGARAIDVEPEALSRLMMMEPPKDGEPVIIGGLKIDKVVQEVAAEMYEKALRRDPARTAEALEAPNGMPVKGFGDMDPDLRRVIAATLYASDTPENPLPPELAARVNRIMESAVSSEPTSEAKALVDALASAPAKSAALDAFAKWLTETVDGWKADANADHYLELLGRLRKATEGRTLSGRERAVAEAIYGYIDSLEETIRGGDKAGKVENVAREWFDTLRRRFHGGKNAGDLTAEMERRFAEWRRGKGADDPAAGSDFNLMLRDLRGMIERATLTAEERAAFEKAHHGIQSSPWIFRDAKGQAMMGWRPVQFQALIHFLATLAQESRAGAPPRIFLQLKTGGGKTWLSALGLVPFLRADAATLGNKPALVYLVPQANLKAQVRLQFANVGLKIEVMTYEEFKSKIAQGKSRGRDKALDYIVLGDEGDAATQQPMLTIGRVSGTVPRFTSVFNVVDGIGAGLAQKLEARRTTRVEEIQGEADRTRFEMDAALRGASPETAKDLQAKAKRLQDKTRALSQARTALERDAAEQGVRDSAADLSRGLAALGADAEAARGALARVTAVLDARETPAAEQAHRQKLRADIEKESARQGRLLPLLGSEESLRRLEIHVEARSSQLSRAEEGLVRQIADAKRTGQTRRASLLEQDLAGVRRRQAFLARFEVLKAGKPGETVARLHRSLAAGEAQGGVAPEQMSQWRAQLAEALRDLPRGARAAAQEYGQALRRMHGLQRNAADLQRKFDATGENFDHPSTPEGRRLRDGLEAAMRDHGTVRGEAERLKQRLVAMDASVKTTPAAERARALLRESSADVLATIDRGGENFESEAADLLAERRGVLEAFGADEHALYRVFRDIKERMKGYAGRTRTATGGGLKSIPQKDVEWNDALKAQMERDIRGKSLPRLAWNWFRGHENGPTDIGLARWYAWKMLKALKAETMPVEVADTLRYHFWRSLLFPGAEDNWVATEVRRMYDGYFDDPSKSHVDGIKRRFEAVHEGEWYASMDNPTRRFWELEYGVDLTLPYTNDTLSTIKDMTENRMARFVLYSGTADDGLQKHLRDNDIPLAGEGSRMPAELDLKASLDKVAGGFEAVSTKADEYNVVRQAMARQISSRGEVVVEPEAFAAAPAEVQEALKAREGGSWERPRVLKVKDYAPKAGETETMEYKWLRAAQEASHEAAGDAQRVRVRPEADLDPKAGAVSADVRDAVSDFLKNKGWSKKSEVVVSYSDFKAWARESKLPNNVRDQALSWFQSLRKTQGDTGAVVIVMPDTPNYKVIRNYLKKACGLTDAQITAVFSDVTALGERRPEARVVKQMNVRGLGDPGDPSVEQTTQVIIGDRRTFARGLDLYLKKYTSFTTVFLDPQLYAESDVIQGAGRNDPDRMLDGAHRDFRMVVNVQSVKDLKAFWSAVRSDAFFAELRGDPRFREFVRAHGNGRSADVDLSLFTDYVAHRAHDGSAEGERLAAEYDQKVLLLLQKSLIDQQSKMGKQKLDSSGVGDGSGGERPDSRFPGVGEAR